MVSSAGSIMNSYAYKPFGGFLRNVSVIPNPFQFNGQFGVMTDNNGLSFMRNRFYSPAIGRFESQDPMNILGGDANFYSYVNNSPLQTVDPLGLSFEFGSLGKSVLDKIWLPIAQLLTSGQKLLAFEPPW